MATRGPRCDKEEHMRRALELYEQRIRPQVEAGNQGKILAIDVDSGAFEVAEDTLAACQRLYERYPDAQPFCLRIGSIAVHRFRTPFRAPASA